MAAPGDRLKLSVWHDKASREVTVQLGKVPAERLATVAQGEGGSLGLTVRPLEQHEMRGAGIDHGLVVEDVAGPAAQAGIETGDIVLALNGKPVRSVEQVRELLKSHPQHVALLIARDGQQIFVPVDLG